jgi:hypothetical protein
MVTVTPSISGQFDIFWVARESLTTVDPWPSCLRYTTKLDPVLEGPAPNLAPFDDDSMTFLYDLMEISSLRSALPDSLQPCLDIWVSLHFVRSRLWLCFLLFWASNQPCCLLQCSGTTLRVRLRHPLVFLFVPTCRETCFSSHCYSTYFLFFLFWIIIPTILPATMLRY